MSANDDFFGGAITPPSAPPTAGAPTNPHLANTKEYGNFGGGSSAKMATTPLTPVLVGVAIVAIALVGFFCYRTFFSGTQIELPEQLIGLERFDPDGAMAQSVDESLSELEAIAGGDVEMHFGLYGREAETLVVVAGETGSSDTSEVDDFFEGMSTTMTSQLPTATLTDADSGARGGTMKCFEVTQAGVRGGGCQWVAEDTVGIVIVAPLTGDVAEMTRAVRDEIEN